MPPAAGSLKFTQDNKVKRPSCSITLIQQIFGHRLHLLPRVVDHYSTLVILGSILDSRFIAVC